jgi:hypothetical protein
MTNFVRIYERSYLDQYCPMTYEAFKQSNLVLMLLDGCHLNTSGRPISNMGINEQFIETVSFVEVVIGGLADEKLKCFAAILSAAYAARHPSSIVETFTADQGLSPKV